MSIPTPEPGLVISYDYLWHREAKVGRDEGRKDRPSVIILASQAQLDGETLVTVLPITHGRPQTAGSAIEIPLPIKRHLKLDDELSWIVVSEGNQFIWPGYDLRKAHGSDEYDYGFLPPKFFVSVLTAFRTYHRAHNVKLTPR